MNYRIEVSRPAQSEIKSLAGHVRAQARELIGGLAEDPRPPRAKELRGKPNIFRIWLATHWRIAYEVEDGLKRVRVLRVRRKEEMDYESLKSSE